MKVTNNKQEISWLRSTGSGNYIRRLVSPVQAQLDSLHGGLRDLLHMLLTQIPRLERAAGLFSSFLHLMDFISRHFLTTTQWSSSASISQFSSVNCQVTVPRKWAIIFSLISRNIFKEWREKTSWREARLILRGQTCLWKDYHFPQTTDLHLQNLTEHRKT